VEALIREGANVNAKNIRKQHPVDMAGKSNTAVRVALEKAQGTASPDWDGVSGREQDPHTRKKHQGASAPRQQRAADWRAGAAAQWAWQDGPASGSQPAQGWESGWQAVAGWGGSSSSASGSQPAKGGKSQGQGRGKRGTLPHAADLFPGGKGK